MESTQLTKTNMEVYTLIQCCQVKIKFLAQWPSKTSPKVAQKSPQIIIKLFILNVASDTPLPIKRGMHFKYVTHKVFT